MLCNFECFTRGDDVRPDLVWVCRFDVNEGELEFIAVPLLCLTSRNGVKVFTSVIVGCSYANHDVMSTDVFYVAVLNIPSVIRIWIFAQGYLLTIVGDYSE